MRVAKIIIPSAGRVIRGESTVFRTAAAVDWTTTVIFHLFVVALSISVLGNGLAKFEDMHRFVKAKSMLHLSLTAGTIESAVISLLAAYRKRKVATAIILDLAACWIFLVPQVLLEILIVVAVCGQGVFSSVMPYVSQIWLGSLLAVILIMSVQTVTPKTKPDSSIKFIEDSFCGTERQQIVTVVNTSEYGSLEEVSLLSSESSSDRHKETISNTQQHSSTQSPWQIRRRSFSDYLAGLRLWSDILVLTLVVIILRHSAPIVETLQPVAKTALGAISSTVSIPVLVAAGLMALITVHFVFVR